MDQKAPLTRPSYLEALDVWRALLRERGLPSDIIWVFDENLCFELDPHSPDGFRLGFQTVFTPPPTDAEQVAYYYFSEFDVPLVWYRLGSAQGRSVCLLLCDKWFEDRKGSPEFTSREEWHMLFRLGEPKAVEEIRDRQRWERRLLRNRPLHDLDFCMSLQAVRETIAHGRVLTSYERYGLKLLHAWHRLLGEKNKS
ncbi:MAG TPA: hypothetical protein VEC99_06635 [Clostridia bacterium]|nr:hypothetical protein [Clostridia bacterium]